MPANTTILSQIGASIRTALNSLQTDLQTAKYDKAGGPISGPVTISGLLTANGAIGTTNITASDTLGVTGATTLGSTLGVTGASTLSSTLAVTGATTLNSTLAVIGNSTLTGLLTANGAIGTTNISASGTLGVTGASTLSSTLAVTGATTLTGLLTANGAINTTNISASGTLGVTGASTLTGLLTANGAINTTNISASGTLGVTGATTLSSTLSVNGASTLTGLLTANGAINTTNVSASGTLGVTGVSTLTGQLNANGGISTTNISASGNFGIAGNVSSHFIPITNVTYDLGSPSKMWRDLYIGPGSLYVNGQKVIQDNSGTITITADTDQNIQIKTGGGGDIEFYPSGSGSIEMKGNLSLQAGKKLLSGDGQPIDIQPGVVNLLLTGNTTSGNLIVNGNLTVNGTTTTINTETLTVADNIITLNADATGTPSQNAGLTVERGDSPDVQIIWDESIDAWKLTNDGTTFKKIIGEGDITKATLNITNVDNTSDANKPVSTATQTALNSNAAEHGTLSSLTTSQKGTLVGAINELDTDVGAPASLTTTAKSNVVAAINELDAEHGTLSSLTTSQKGTIVGAINELDTDVGAPASLTTTAKSNVVSAINELDTDVGAPASLTTTAKSNVVAAINELDAEHGVLSSLTTTAKNTIVASINELDADVGSITSLTVTVNDTYSNNVSLLLKGDGANGSTTITDSSSSPKTITLAGSIQLSTTQSKSGGSSIYYAGVNNYLYASNMGTLGTADWTVEGWFYQLGDTGTPHHTTYFNYNNYSDGFLFRREGVYLNSGSPIMTGITLSNNVWTHLAFVRTGNTFNIYVDGVLTRTCSYAGGFSPASTSLYIGASSHSPGNEGFYGYIDDVRFTKGIARYTSNFTPPTALATSPSNIVSAINKIGADVGSITSLTVTVNDTYSNNVSLLLKGDGTNGSTTFTDSSSSPKTVTRSGGNIQISTTQSKFGGSSLYFDGTGYLSISNLDLVLSSTEYTIEGWFYTTDASYVYQGVFGSGADWQGISYQLNEGVDGKMALFISGSGCPWGSGLKGTTTIVSNTWYHFALVKQGTTIKTYLNGNLDSTASGCTPNNFSQFNIGCSQIASRTFRGYIDDFRVTNGVARYTANFIPPVEPFGTGTASNLVSAINKISSDVGSYSSLNGGSTTSTDTYFNNVVLLLKGDGTNGSTTITDSSLLANVLSNPNSATISTSVKKYDTGSISFAGGGKRLETPASTNFQFGTSDFTIECWVYWNSNPASNTCVIRTDSGNGANGILFGYLGNRVYASSNGSTWDIISDAQMGAVSAGSWYHLALTRSGTTFRGFVNGVLGFTATSSGSIQQTTNIVRIGAANSASGVSMDGYIDDLRITKGVARYTANFTPPESLGAVSSNIVGFINGLDTRVGANTSLTTTVKNTIVAAINEVNASSGVTPGSYGATTSIPVITFDARGRATAASTVTIPSGTVNVTGDLTMSGVTGTPITNATLVNSGVAAGSYGSSSNIPVITFDAKGRATSASTVAVNIPSGSISVTGGDLSMSGTTGTAITNATLANTGVTAGTYHSVTVDAKGRVTAGTNPIIAATDISHTYASAMRANTLIHGGGTVTVNASGYVYWSQRFIVISNGNGTNFSTSGYFDIICPTSGTITGVGGASNVTATAAGIPLTDWNTLYYILPISSGNASLPGNFRIVNYTSVVDVPYNWIRICSRNGDAGNQMFYFCNGLKVAVNNSKSDTDNYINSAGGTISGDLEITGPDNVTRLLRVGGIGPQGTGAIEVGQSASYGGGMLYNGDGSPAFATNEGTDKISFYRNDGGTRVVVFQYAYNSNDVYFYGNITSAGDITSNSDARLKENVEVISDAVNKVKQIRGVTFNKIGETSRKTGLIAQEVEAVLPEAVMQRDEYKSVAYGNVVSLLIEAIKEQQQKIEELERRLNEKIG